MIAVQIVERVKICLPAVTRSSLRGEKIAVVKKLIAGYRTTGSDHGISFVS
jgi:hypothetical protein